MNQYQNVIQVLGVASSLLAFFVGFRYYRHTPRGRSSLVRFLIVFALLSLALAEIVDVLETLMGTNRTQAHELFAILAEIALALGFARLFQVEMAKEAALEAEQGKRGPGENKALTDTLTGLANRRYFDQKLNLDLSRARQDLRALSLVIFDIDDFQHINERFGKKAGDKVLFGVSSMLRTSIRETDVPVRLDADELGLILPDAGLVEAVRVAERIRNLVERTAFEWEEDKFNLTVSVGVAGGVGDELPNTPGGLYALADQAMYRAKQEGGNQVVVR